jgi:hypothetical protein
VKTIFHRTHVDLRKWFFTIAVMMSPEEDPTVRDLALALDVNKNTACYLAMRISTKREREFLLLRRIADEVLGRLA